MTDTTTQESLSASEFARAMSVNKATIGRWIAKGRVQAERTEWGYRIPAAELGRMLAERDTKHQ